MLHHSLVQRIEKQNKSMFGKGAKIVVSVRPVPTDHPQGPILTRNNHSLRFVFRSGGEEDVGFDFIFHFMTDLCVFGLTKKIR